MLNVNDVRNVDGTALLFAFPGQKTKACCEGLLLCRFFWLWKSRQKLCMVWRKRRVWYFFCSSPFPEAFLSAILSGVFGRVSSVIGKVLLQWLSFGQESGRFGPEAFKFLCTVIAAASVSPEHLNIFQLLYFDLFGSTLFQTFLNCSTFSRTVCANAIEGE